MHKLFTLAIAGLAAGWLTLASPSVSQAQGWQYGGPGYGGYSSRYGGYSGGYYGGYYPGGYGRSQIYGGYYQGQGYYHGGYGNYGRPAIVHPEVFHWTPGRGLHTHGHIHVPHHGHYHTYRY